MHKQKAPLELQNTVEKAKSALLAAALPHVPFDGWSQSTLNAAIDDSGIDRGLAQALFARGGIDMALVFHQQGDALMISAFAEANLTGLRYRDKVALAVRLRLEACPDPELVRRASVLFALPSYAPEGAKALWGTADAIWQALGDNSQDINYYTKRATLCAVYGATVLFWLGDQSDNHKDTWAFLDRRIDNVMNIEKTKAALRENPFAATLLAGPFKFLGQITPPRPRNDLPGQTKV
ncbi:MAG: COQ9 family protein [Paracoccaceae bacterium]|nr:COQ9 family protein [Paracoccaceae bacterium]MDO7732415.1 COQ9 family protein [Paracoccaceae bacterium]MDP5322917.1 COQ9 family protein [Paracoccaceae bacterium]MDP5351796.1 COQ9 family protein [Paracoccaceae bacterium]MDP5353742.1 COQ9 family protein [Paracoccaceae bacterium]